MSAIAGILSIKHDEQIIETMLQVMRQRGPDGEGCYCTKDHCILHTRMDTVDLMGETQPLILDHGNERYIITFDGVLYNREEIRNDLIRCDHTFIGYSDAEVLLHGYVQWKEKILEKCNGVFAFAVLEEHSGKVFLARDRIGVKPLFYKMHLDGMLFASEMKMILCYPNVCAEIDKESIAQLILLGPGRMPGSGVLRGLHEIEPGCYGFYEKGKLRITRYWQLKDRTHTDSFDETLEHVRHLLLDSVCRQMTSQMPVGTFLSGGLDSSLISAICDREMDLKGKTLETFSLDYANNDKYFHPGKFQPNSDNEYISLMLNFLDSHHHWTVLTAEDLVDHMEEAVIARDLPGMADVDSSLLAFCGQIKPYAKVVLSGECADEIFGGYPWFRDPAIRDVDGFPWSQNTAQRAALLHPHFRGGIDAGEFIHNVYSDSLAQCDILPENTPGEKRMKQMIYLNFRWFMQTLLDRKDRMSTRQGIEARVPYCDYRIAEYMYAVPWEMKDFRGYEKGLLRYAMRGIIPDTVLFRKKSPYPKTHDPRYRQIVTEMFYQMVNDYQAPIFEIIDKSALENLVHQDFAWPWYGQLMQLPQTMAYMLQLNFWLKHYKVQLRQ